MRYLPLALALLLAAGCTIEVARPGVTPPAATPRPTASATTAAPASPTPSAPRSYGSTDVVMRLGYRGGNCAQPPCDGEMVFYADGRVTRTWTFARPEGQVDPKLVAAVAAEIGRADFAAMKARTFTGTCGTAVDAPESVYTFVTAGGDEVLPGCQYAIDHEHPLFQAVRALEDAANATAAYPTPSASPTLSPDAYVLVIRRRGGRCAYGPCEGMMTFQADGRFSDSEGRDGFREGRVDPALAAAVVAETEKADFAALKSKPFTGTCPTAYDGQEKIYSFPVGVSEENLQSCTYEIDEAHPLFRAVRAIEAAAKGTVL